MISIDENLFFSHKTQRLLRVAFSDPSRQPIKVHVLATMMIRFNTQHTGPISVKLGTKHPWVKGFQYYSNEGHHPSLRVDNSGKALSKFKKLNQNWHKASSGEGDSSLFKRKVMPFSKYTDEKNLLLQTHRTNFIQTWLKASFEEEDLTLNK